MINDLWYKNAVIYCLNVGTYMDSNADGIGDFQGLMRRLDYSLSAMAGTAWADWIIFSSVDVKKG